MSTPVHTITSVPAKKRFQKTLTVLGTVAFAAVAISLAIDDLSKRFGKDEETENDNS